MKATKMMMKRLMKHLFVTILFFISLTCLDAVAPVELRCEYHVNPLGIDLLKPRLSWQLESEGRNQQQSAYRILVASSPDILEQHEGDLWDTGKVRSDESIQIGYQGKPLASHQRCYWKVMAWDKEDQSSAWSEQALWSTGCAGPTLWSWPGPEPPRAGEPG